MTKHLRTASSPAPRFAPRWAVVVPLAVATLALGTFGCATRAHDMTRNLLEGNDAALRGDYATAVNHYETALDHVPDSAPAKRNLGIVLVKTGNYKRARQLLTEVSDTYVQDLELFYFLGEACRGLEDFKSAASNYQKALKIQPKDLRAQKALAWTWHKQGLFDRALLLTKPLLKEQSADLQLRLIVGSTYNKLKRHKDTIDLLSPLEKANFQIQSRDKVSGESERALLMTALADAYAGSTNCERALPLYTEVLKTRPFLATALTGSARCDLRFNNSQRAIAKLERAVKSDPETREAHYLLGGLYEKIDANKAIFFHRRFLLLTKNDPEFVAEIQASRRSLAGLERKTANSTPR